jgi:ABC-type multidrug transport system fused ATPase/permease subunit
MNHSAFLSGWKLLSIRIRYRLLFSVILGLALFLMEAGFAMALQGFLVILGFMSPEDNLLPTWWPGGRGAAVLILASMGVLRAAGSFLRNVVAIEAQQIFLRSYRQQIFRQGLANSSRESSGNIITVFTEVVFKASGIVPNFVQLLVSVTLSVTLFLGCIRLAPLQTLYGCGVLALFFVSYLWVSRHVSVHGRVVGEKIQAVNTTLLNAFKHVQFLRLHGALGDIHQKMATDLIDYEKHNMSYVRLSTLKGVLGQAVGVLVVALVTWTVPTKSPAVMVAFFYLFSRLGAAVNELNGCLIQNKFLKSHVERLAVEVGQPIDDEEKKSPHLWIPRSRGGKLSKLSTQQLGFSWGNENQLFKNLDLELQPGGLLLLKGESGVGKSTLASVLLGLLEPSEGKVELDGHSDQLLPRLSPIGGYVGPEPILISGTIKENLLYGLPPDHDITEDSMSKALSRVGLVSIANDLKQPLYEHAALSTGQKQRLCFARVILREPSLVVLDEATANLDEENERAIISIVSDMMKEGVAFIAITHRQSFDQLATQKLSMKPGSHELEVGPRYV